MKLNYKIANGPTVAEFVGVEGTMEDALALLMDENCISLTVKKKTPAQYFKEWRKKQKEMKQEG